MAIIIDNGTSFATRQRLVFGIDLTRQSVTIFWQYSGVYLNFVLNYVS